MWYDFGRCTVSVEPWAGMIANGHARDWPWVATPKALTGANQWHWDGLLMCALALSRGGHGTGGHETVCLAVMHDGQGNSQTILHCCQPLGKGCLCPTSMTWGHKTPLLVAVRVHQQWWCTTLPVPLEAHVRWDLSPNAQPGMAWGAQFII